MIGNNSYISNITIENNVMSFLIEYNDNYDYSENEELTINDTDLSKNKNTNIQISEIIYNESKDIQCCICLESLPVGQKIAKLDCKHIFHIKCINDWCKRKTVCPLCRKSINITDNNITK